MTHSPTSTLPNRKDQPFLSKPLPLAVPQSPPRSGGFFRWIFAALGTGGVAGTQGYFSVTSFIAKSTLSGGIFGAGALVCGGACIYCVYRVVIAIKYRFVQPIAPAQDIAASKANLQMLHMINTRLNGLLNDTQEIDLEAGVDDVQLHESIGRQLQELEQMLPQMRTELGELRETVQAALLSRSMSSPGAGLDSPSVDASFERGLLGKLDALSKKVGKDRLSRNASILSSAIGSPTGTSTYSFGASPGASPVTRTRPPGRRITFESVNDGGTPMTPATSANGKEKK